MQLYIMHLYKTRTACIFLVQALDPFIPVAAFVLNHPWIVPLFDDFLLSLH